MADLPPPSAPSAITPGQQVLEQWAPLNQFISPGPVSRETARLLDSRAIKDFHLTGLRMMELAAFQAAEIAAVMARPRMQSPDDRVAVICGRGNNGGDGFVLARYLASWGFPVEIYILGEREKILEDALINLRRAERLSELLRATHDRPPVQADALQAAPLGLLMTPGWCPAGPTERFQPLAGLVPAIELVELTTEEHLAQNAEVLAQAALIVDGMLGTGMVGDVRGLNRAAIGWVNAARTARSGRGESAAPIPVLALDTPSGIDASTGAVLGEAVQADVTVTFGAPKIAFTESAPHPEGRRYAGDVFLVEIGWPPVKVRAW